MRPKITILISLLACFLTCASSCYGQFYSGHQMYFGKNRVQFEKFDWFYYRYERFDTYFYGRGNNTALMTAELTNKLLPQMETFFEHKLKKRIIFVVYENLSDFRQSNIGLETNNGNYNIGGVSQIVDNIAFVYVEGSTAQIESQVRSVLATMILQEMLYGEVMASKLANSIIINLPAWYCAGLTEYVSHRRSAELDGKIKNAMAAHKFEDINYITGDDAAVVGAAIWNYIAMTFGESVISNIVYLTRITKNHESGFLYVLGISLPTLQKEIVEYYKAQYTAFDIKSREPESRNLLRRSKRDTRYYQFRYNSNSDMAAWAENSSGRYKIRIADCNTGRKTTIMRREHRLEQITDYTYPLLQWHPSGKMLGFIIERKGKTYYGTYFVDDKKCNYIKLALPSKVTAFDYSDDGLNIVMACYVQGQSDIYLYNAAANIFTPVTNDLADDANPKFIDKSTRIIFASNRANANTKDETSKNQLCNDIFVYDIKTKTLSQVTNSRHTNEDFPNLKSGKYLYTSDSTGINNLYAANIDSAISFVDTTTHYRYLIKQQRLTNFQNNILEFNSDKYDNSTAMVYNDKNKYKLLLDNDLRLQDVDAPTTAMRMYTDNVTKFHASKPSIPAPATPCDTLQYDKEHASDYRVDIDNYAFLPDVVAKEHADDEEFDANGKPKKQRIGRYFTTFYTNYLVSRIDFGFLNNNYQKFTGSAFYFNPGFNLIFKIGTSDLFEDYRITAGYRFAVNMQSGEYLLSFENIKRRWNKQLILHRQTIDNSLTTYTKSYTNDMFYITRYPFSQVDAIQLTSSLREDKTAFLAFDDASLALPDTSEYWAGFKAEYIFDNSKEICTNILSGMRIKVFGELFCKLSRPVEDLYVVGADFRFYKPIHKNLIFAVRAATSASFGRARLIYYLGGIDNWINLSSRVSTFNRDIRIDPTINYAYQAVATNLRGFSQNIRNGSNFAVVNAELRFPVISYFFKRPIRNDFLRNFQIAGFVDVGSAWTGLSPFDGENAYENDYFDNYPVEVTLRNNNNPIVAGYGFGLRSKLFGYFIRADWAWGINNGIIQPCIFYLSLSLDF